jgi:phosphoglycerate dehydrogenase-like enzyme
MRVAVLDDYQRVARDFADWTHLPAGVEPTFFHAPFADREAAVAALAPFEVIVAMRERTAFPAGVIARLPALRLLVTTGMRNAAIDLNACRAKGVTVCGTGAVGTPTAELTWGLILALVKRIPAEDRALREGAWQTGMTTSLGGKRLGVVGLGKLGTQVARVGAAFGMEVVAWSPNLTDDRAHAGGARRVEKGELFATADVVTLHLVLSQPTRGIVGAAEISAMKPSAILVNTARAGLVDEAALIAALREGRLGGAGMDVFAIEPLPAGSPLRAAPNTMLTPHLGYVTAENYQVFYRNAVEDIVAWAAGKPVRVLG